MIDVVRRHRDLIAQIVRFGLTGGLSTLVNVGIYWAGSDVFRFDLLDGQVQPRQSNRFLHLAQEKHRLRMGHSSPSRASSHQVSSRLVLDFVCARDSEYCVKTTSSRYSVRMLGRTCGYLRLPAYLSDHEYDE